MQRARRRGLAYESKDGDDQAPRRSISRNRQHKSQDVSHVFFEAKEDGSECKSADSIGYSEDEGKDDADSAAGDGETSSSCGGSAHKPYLPARRNSLAEWAHRYAMALRRAAGQPSWGHRSVAHPSARQRAVLARHILAKDKLEQGPADGVNVEASLRATMPHVRGVRFGSSSASRGSRRVQGFRRPRTHGLGRMRYVISALSDLLRGGAPSAAAPSDARLAEVLHAAAEALDGEGSRAPSQPSEPQRSAETGAASAPRRRAARGIVRWHVGHATERAAAIARDAGKVARGDVGPRIWYASQLHVAHGRPEADGEGASGDPSFASLLPRHRRRTAVRAELAATTLPASQGHTTGGGAHLRYVAESWGRSSAAARRRRGYGHHRRTASASATALPPAELDTARRRRTRSVSLGAMPGRRDVVGPYGLHEPPSPPSTALLQVLRRDAELAALLHAGPAHDAHHRRPSEHQRVVVRGPASFARHDRFVETHGDGGDGAFFHPGAVHAEHRGRPPPAAFVHPPASDPALSDAHVRRRSRRSLGEASFGRRQGRASSAATGAGAASELDEDGHVLKPEVWRGAPSQPAHPEPAPPRVKHADFSRRAGREIGNRSRDAVEHFLDEEGNLLQPSDLIGDPSDAPAVVAPVKWRHGAALHDFGRYRGRGAAASGMLSSNEFTDILDEDGHVLRPSGQRTGHPAAPAVAQPLQRWGKATADLHFGRRSERGLHHAHDHAGGLDEDGHVNDTWAARPLPTGHMVPPHPGARRAGAGVAHFGQLAMIGDGHARPPPGHRGADGELDEGGGLVWPRH